MALGPRLDLRQSQSLVMTPQLQQAIKLLALSNLELEAYLAEALEGNPLLDTASADGDGAGDERGEEPGEAAPEAAGEGPDAEPTLASDAGSDLDVDFDERFHHDSASDSVGLSGSGEAVDFDSFAGAEGTLYDHLLAQVGERFDGIEAMVAEQIVALIDEAGYLRADLADLAQRLGVPLALVEAVLAGKLGGVGLDVYSQEPLARSGHPLSPLFGRDDVILFPHLTFFTTEAMRRLSDDTLARGFEILDGRPVQIRSHDPRLRAQTRNVAFA